MITPKPKGYPSKSAIADLEFAVVEQKSHWSFDQREHEKQRRYNLIKSKCDSKLSELGI